MNIEDLMGDSNAYEGYRKLLEDLTGWLQNGPQVIRYTIIDEGFVVSTAYGEGSGYQTCIMKAERIVHQGELKWNDFSIAFQENGQPLSATVQRYGMVDEVDVDDVELGHVYWVEEVLSGERVFEDFTLPGVSQTEEVHFPDVEIDEKNILEPPVEEINKYGALSKIGSESNLFGSND